VSKKRLSTIILARLVIPIRNYLLHAKEGLDIRVI
jgi:hypothetical protein